MTVLEAEDASSQNRHGNVSVAEGGGFRQRWRGHALVVTGYCSQRLWSFAAAPVPLTGARTACTWLCPPVDAASDPGAWTKETPVPRSPAQAPSRPYGTRGRQWFLFIWPRKPDGT